MGKKLIITEKPSVARDFARVLGVSGRGNGYIENQDYVISWCVGHLVEMLYPEAYDERYKKWKLEDLPFLPENYKYGVIENVKDQYQTVHTLLRREDISRVYWAGDSGKEGQTIEENIRNFGGVRPGMEELRVWIDSQTDEEIKRGIREAKPMSDYANLGLSGIMRTIEDYALGINFSRALSVKYGRLINEAAGTKSYVAIAVGRVMTCVLGMVVRREREIRSFTETPFYKIGGSFADEAVKGEWKSVEGSGYFNSPLLYKENGFLKREDAQALIEELNGKEAVLEQIEKSVSKKKAPLLFNLSELQAECAKQFKISPDQTLEVAQFLYERKLTTYPRTDARVLTKAVCKEIPKNLNGLTGLSYAANFAQKILKEQKYIGLEKSIYTDDSKVTDHYAIIPTGQTGAAASLNPLQAKVYELIVRRFLAIFFPPAQYQNVKLTVAIEKEKFFVNQKTLIDPGYLLVSPAFHNGDEEEETVDQKKKAALEAFLQTAKEGQPLDVDGFEIREGKTNPPKRYTSGTMVLAMENAGNLIEEEELRAQIKNTGIGTSATRAEIIKKLITIGYLHLNAKTQVLTPTNIGEMIYEVVFLSIPSLLNPEMTASWEKGLDGITRGEVDMKQYRGLLEDYIRKQTLDMVERNLYENIRENIQSLLGENARGFAAIRKLGLSCPDCGGELQTTSFGYGCSNYRNQENPCRFSVGEIAGRRLSQEEFQELIEKGQTPVLAGFVSKKKKNFKAKLILKKDEAQKTQVAFDFDEVEPDYLENVSCPHCQGRIEITPFGYRCENAKAYQGEDGNPHFSLGKILGKEIPKTQVLLLLTEGKTQTIRGFKSKNKTKFDACLKLEGSRVVFSFDDVEKKVISGVSCPNCGGEIVKSTYGFCCKNHDRNDPESCRFAFGTICGKEITETQCKQLLKDGITKTITGFQSKAGKSFDARLELDREEDGKVKGLKFNFDVTEEMYLPEVSCPVCKSPLVQTKYGCRCLKYGADENPCGFQVGTIAGVTIPKEELLRLLKTGHTGEIDGFLSKKGLFFRARLKWDEEFRPAFDFSEENGKAEKKEEE